MSAIADVAIAAAIRADIGSASDLRMLRFRLQRVAQGKAKPDEVQAVAREARRLVDLVLDYLTPTKG
jgi:hypothetical protein